MLSIASRLFYGRVLPMARISGNAFRPSMTPPAAYQVCSMEGPSVVVTPIYNSIMARPDAAVANFSSPSSISTIVGDYMTSLGLWLIKRTFQPSLIRKKRQHGYLARSKTVGGRKILRRRRAKNRARLFGA